jgi:hypothetical protein
LPPSIRKMALLNQDLLPPANLQDHNSSKKSGRFSSRLA